MSLFFGNSSNNTNLFGGSNVVAPGPQPGTVTIGNSSAVLQLTNFEGTNDALIISDED